MARKKRKKKGLSKKRTIFFSILSLCVIIVMAYIFSTYFIELYNKYTEKKELVDKISQLSEEEEKLKGEVEKLNDPEYIARYAREKYLYSKNGEFIIKIPE
ncbi:MAG: septum formation initiator family protein [Bacilli bacterium]|nr:septum formation initiator family protein [Bacilli bacterium]